MDWLLIIVLLPLLAAVSVGFVPGSQRQVIRSITLGASGLALLCALIAFCTFKVGGGIQFETKWTWVESLGLHFHLAADGINIGIVLMGAIVGFAAVCCA
ncbi:MAG TPA: NADH-quinone oxidoreductase subunit M, partial [Verrucomicrobiota bacterium]|nr:NADH-quinone oxidoreductase subunit M [Verrucomicrobiota bacterium]